GLTVRPQFHAERHGYKGVGPVSSYNASVHN
ncbi:MAG: hypothetical protein JWL65_4381, partial [Gammaproteobacteria bacterium]|nr:hypothetical protein [Gammaproteobacteria bacterium]